MRLLPHWWRTHFLPAEAGLAGLCTIGFALWADRPAAGRHVDIILQGNRSTIYATLASVLGSLLGFVITAVSIIIGLAATDRLSVLRESKHYSLLWKVFAAAIRALGLATLGAFVGLVLDRDGAPVRGALYLCVLTALLAVLRLARCIWALDQVVCLMTAPSKARSGDDA